MATCNYVRDMTGVDPARPWRGSYSDEAGAMAIYQPIGGVLALFKHGMALAGFHVATALEWGCPCVCDVAGHEVSGIWLGGKVLFMAQGRGAVEMRARVLGAWEI